VRVSGRPRSAARGEERNEGRSAARARWKDGFLILRTTTVKLQGRLKGDAFLGGRGCSVRLLGSVEGVDVSLMVLLVMKLHDLT
jgi:hypothetical protein